MMAVKEFMAGMRPTAVALLLLSGLALGATTGLAGTASASTAPGHTIATAGTLDIGDTAAGGGGPIDFWKVKLNGGDKLQLLTATPAADPGNTNTGYNFELFPPGTTDASFPTVPPVSTSGEFATSHSVLDLQAPYNGTFFLAVCEDTNTPDCRGVDSSAGRDPMLAYSFSTSLVNGGIPGSVAAKETRAADTIAKAPRIGLGHFEAGGGAQIDFWKVALNKGDKIQLSTLTPAADPGNTNTSYNFELFAPGTTDTSFPQHPPVSAAGEFGLSKDTLYLTAPSTGVFVFAVCEDINTTDCRGVDSGTGRDPMLPYAFTPRLVAGHESKTSLHLSASRVTYGHEKSLKFSVTVTALFGGTVTGKVGISDGKKTVCVIKLAKGKGSCSPTSSTELKPGKYAITAFYAGNKAASKSAAGSLTVKK